MIELRGDLQQLLERATAHANVLLDRAIGGPPTAEHEARLRAEAHALWEESTLPSAMFETVARDATHANAAWRSLFETRPVPEALYDAVSTVRTSAELVHLPELALGLLPTPCFCAASLRPRFGVPETVIVVCSAITDEVIARHLDVPPTALVWSAPIEGGPIWTSSAWSHYTGARVEDWRSAIHADDLPRCLYAFQEASRQRVSSNVEIRIRREDGSYRWHRAWFTMDLFGRWFGSATENRDQYATDDERAQLVAQAHAARADAEQASRLKDQFLAAVSHELRAPMTTMLLWEKVLRDDNAEPGVRAQALAAIRESAVAQSRLVADLLDVSRAISGKLFVDLRAVDLAQIVAHRPLEQRELEEEPRPTTGDAIDSHDPAVVLDDLPAHPETEAGAGIQARGVRAPIFVEDEACLRLRDPWTGIAHRHAAVITLNVQAYDDRAPRRRVLQRVREHVGDHSLDSQIVELERDGPRCIENDAILAGGWCRSFDHGLEQRTQIDQSPYGVHGVGGPAVDQVVNHAIEERDVLHQSSKARSRIHVLAGGTPLVEQRDLESHRRQRRLEIVRDLHEVFLPHIGLDLGRFQQARIELASPESEPGARLHRGFDTTIDRWFLLGTMKFARHTARVLLFMRATNAENYAISDQVVPEGERAARTSRRLATRCSKSIGFARCRSKPAANARSASDAIACAVRAIAGRSLPVARSLRMKLKPSSPGIAISQTITVGIRAAS
jgi:PAS domain-containing protein